MGDATSPQHLDAYDAGYEAARRDLTAANERISELEQAIREHREAVEGEIEKNLFRPRPKPLTIDRKLYSILPDRQEGDGLGATEPKG